MCAAPAILAGDVHALGKRAKPQVLQVLIRLDQLVEGEQAGQEQIERAGGRRKQRAADAVTAQMVGDDAQPLGLFGQMIVGVTQRAIVLEVHQGRGDQGQIIALARLDAGDPITRDGHFDRLAGQGFAAIFLRHAALHLATGAPAD